MIVVRLDQIHVDTVRRLVAEMVQSGLKQNADFDWAYHPGRWDPMTGDVEKYVEFMFYNDKNATWFGLKYKGSIK